MPMQVNECKTMGWRSEHRISTHTHIHSLAANINVFRIYSKKTNGIVFPLPPRNAVHFDPSDYDKKMPFNRIGRWIASFLFPTFYSCRHRCHYRRPVQLVHWLQLRPSTSCLRICIYTKRTLMRFIYSAGHFAPHIFVCAFIAEHNIRNCFKIICCSGYFKCRFFVQMV